MGVVIRRWVWLESIGVVSGCFPHITYISLLHLYLLFFAAAFLLLFSLLKYIYYIILHCICFFNNLCRCQTVKLRDNCITVVGGMRIIIHVQQWLVNLRCVLAVATRYRELVIETMKSASSS